MAIQRTFCCAVLASALIAGCRSAHQIRDPEFAAVEQSISQSWHSSAPDVEAKGPVFTHLEGHHPVEEFIQFALGQNPDIHAARKQMEAQAHQVPVAASLDDPTLGMTFFPEQIQTASGQQEFALSANQKLPWRGKLTTRAEVAEAQTNVARAELAAVELGTVEAVKRAYYELYYIQKAIEVTESEQGLLTEILAVADTRYKTGNTSQQDVLRAELEILNIENSLIHLRQQLESGQARLARVLHLSLIHI